MADNKENKDAKDAKAGDNKVPADMEAKLLQYSDEYLSFQDAVESSPTYQRKTAAAAALADLEEKGSELARAFRLRKGIGMPADPTEAFRLISPYIESSVFAQIEAGYMLTHGVGCDKDEKKGSALSMRAAVEGKNPRAMINYAFDCENGLGVPKDEKKAFEFYEKAANAGDAFAMTNLGGCYEFGTGVNKALDKAVFWYTKAAQLDDARAQGNLGYCYESGTGVAKDAKAAFEWYGKGAAQGHPRCICNLAYCYEKGVGVAKDEKKAVELYTAAANRDFTHAMLNLACCLEAGIGVNEPDVKQAIDWRERAAFLGDARGMYDLGLAYTRGDIEVDFKLALDWFRRAVAGGHVGSRWQLSRFYEKKQWAEDSGIVQNKAVAKYWREQAKKGGYVFPEPEEKKDEKKDEKAAEADAKAAEQIAIADQEGYLKAHPFPAKKRPPQTFDV